MWDKAAVERLEAWLLSPQGSFALARGQHLMAGIISPWRRRNQTLLEIGCGTGLFLEMFHEAGFDVTGIDSSELMLEKARERLGCRATLRIGNVSHLPFDDAEFDYVAIIGNLECSDSHKDMLAEAFRVAKKGVVIAYANRWSLFRAEYCLHGAVRSLRYAINRRSAALQGLATPQPPEPMLLEGSWCSMAKLWKECLASTGKSPSCCRSTLFIPSMFWRWCNPFSHSLAQFLPFGAVSFMRIDILPIGGIAKPLRAALAPANAGAASPSVVTLDS